tara:strand:- start:323 stop:1207 length:885 start_codon:yes stop_codon:yes gene_type:complete
MALDFSALKKNRGNFDSLMKEVEKIETPKQGGNKDERFWQPEVDKAGNGYAVIRFLPPPKGEDLPWVRTWSHGFQGPTGKWYIENSLTTLNKPDPVSELNTELWNSGKDENKDIARKQKRKLVYIANIYVVTDPNHPENEGKTFLYKFGKKIFDKIKDVMQPQFEDEDKVNPFDFWKGADFKLKIRNVAGYRNYDKSEFGSISNMLDNDDELESIWNNEYSLTEFLDPKNFKSYDELKQKLEMVLSGSGSTMKRAEEIDLQERSRPAPQPVKEVDTSKDEDESLSYFAKLANED